MKLSELIVKLCEEQGKLGKDVDVVFIAQADPEPYDLEGLEFNKDTGQLIIFGE